MDVALTNLFTVRMRLGHFDPEGPLQQIPTSVVCSDYAKELAQDGAAQSCTLVKNEQNTLPIGASVPSVAVIGPNANLSKAMTSYYGSNKVCDNEFFNLVDGVSHHAKNVQTTLGVSSVSTADESGIPAAVKMAQSVDTVILVIGTDLTLAHEEFDATNITLSDAQLSLVKQVAAAAKKPVTVVTMTAVPLDISDILSNPKVGAVVHAGQPSNSNLGVADVLFGKTVPAGRIIQTMYPAAYQHQVSIFDFNMRPGPSEYPEPGCGNPPCPKGTNPGRTHRFYTGKAVVPFGFGLSYTTFSYKLIDSPTGAHSLNPVREMLADTKRRGLDFPSLVEVEAMAPLIEYSINVTNTGSVDADDVVLGFL